MRCRLTRALVLAGLVASLVVTQAALVASGEEGDELVGYTVGIDFASGAVEGAERQPCNFYEIELESAEITQVNDVGVNVQCADGLTFDDDGELYAYRNVSSTGEAISELITIDLDDGDQHLIGPLPPVNVGAGGMTFDAEGDLWLYSFAGGDPACATAGPFCLYEVDPDDASTELVGGATTGVFGLAGDCEEVVALTLDVPLGPPTSTQLQEVDTGDASLEHIVDLPAIFNPEGLDFDDDETLWALGRPASAAGLTPGPTVFEIDPEDGDTEAEDITFEGGADFDGALFGLAISSISCEEPEPPVPAPVPVPIAVEPVFTG